MLSEIDPFYAMEINRLAHRLKGRAVIHMEYGQPSTGAPKAALDVAHRVLDSDAMGYWESPTLQEALAAHYRRRYGLDVAPERFVLTCGASPALVLALTAFFSPGDRVVLARPGYVAYRNVLKALHLEPVEIACGPETRYQLAASHIAALDPAPQGVIVASPANPTGTIIPDADLKAIADVSRARGATVISDEIYHGLSYAGPAATMLAYDPGAFVIGSFSKYFSMVAWRLGWLLAPEDKAERARAFCGNMFLTAPSLSQHAGVAALDATEELEKHVDVYRTNRDLLLKALPRLGLSRIAPPDGAFYVYVDVGHLTDDSLAFCKELLEDTGVAIAPGIDFDPVEGHRFIRISFAVSTAETEEAIRRLEPWFRARAR
ncbi:aminotransferase class I/II-fold pyridoxal phosphate-dependent enzyme [Rhizomicrobium electricum]|uniref:Aminotransferase n=1 Tax=Rhizomicrobium electricum TaxID=480070 RepID=A0ABN1EFB2_9PROT|nr:aminotransferase class I/II-fold pyridoxal phosphate-dependent enzyme [Rhizomicrobium electricum]NIJ48661.1 aspartate/methionine/tyrosine aminotransferase [Rhizomicrobium electricum]